MRSFQKIKKFYNSDGNLIKVAEEDNRGNLNKIEEFIDGKPILVKSKDPSKWIEYNYKKNEKDNSLIITINEKRENGTLESLIEEYYDPNNNLLKKSTKYYNEKGENVNHYNDFYNNINSKSMLILLVKQELITKKGRFEMEYEYDARDRVILYIEKNLTLNKINTTSYYYDEKDKLLKEVYAEEGKKIQWIKNYYYEKDNLVKEVYTKDDKEIQWVKNYYYEKGSLVKEVYTHDGEDKEIVKNYHDEKMNLLRKKLISKYKDKIFISNTSYEYDEKGNKMREIKRGVYDIYDKETIKMSTEIRDYDEDGYLISEQETKINKRDYKLSRLRLEKYEYAEFKINLTLKFNEEQIKYMKLYLPLNDEIKDRLVENKGLIEEDYYKIYNAVKRTLHNIDFNIIEVQALKQGLKYANVGYDSRELKRVLSEILSKFELIQVNIIPKKEEIDKTKFNLKQTEYILSTFDLSKGLKEKLMKDKEMSNRELSDEEWFELDDMCTDRLFDGFDEDGKITEEGLMLESIIDTLAEEDYF